MTRSILSRLLLTASLIVPASALAQVPIIQPGAPGESARELSADEAIEIAKNSYSPDDVRFMQDMIPHHNQAVQMSALVPGRTNNAELIEIAEKIDVSQADEIEFMQGWLAERGEDVPDPTHHHAMHMAHEMAGMATPEQMADLAAAEAAEFDRLFLTLMIAHHEGALTMVEDLLEQPGSAYDPVLLDFTTAIVEDQTAEIERMNVMLVGLSTDPRAGLGAGFDDAEEAISNLRLVASLPKPAGFFDPDNPANMPPVVPKDDEEEDAWRDDDEQSNEDTEWGERSPLLSFSNTDLAFMDDVMVAGNYHGFNVYKLVDDGAPELFSSIVCPGGQGDVSVVGDLLIMSVEQTRGRVDCGLEGITEDVSADRFRGLRIFDISDLSRPVQVGQVQTCRGSHTHSIVDADDERVVVYNSGTSSVRDGEELEGCFDESPGDERTSLFSIDVIEIPVDDPGSARIVRSPRVFADPETGQIGGLWRGGDHGEGTQESRITNQCHDITVFPSAKIAAGACSGNGIIFDISDPMNPERIDDVVDTGFAYWHSATFNNDGTKVLFTDEWGGGSRPRCRTYDPLDWGANAIYDIVDGELEFRSYYKLPAPQVEQENCVAHNGSVVPVPGRDIFVQAWYQGGISVLDFTDSENPFEIAYFDRGPIHEEVLVLGGYWSTYFYDGRIYGTEIVRGLDVFALEPSEFLTENEIAAAALADQGDVFNPQQQFPVSWPAEPVVARAYIDQLNRDNALEQGMADQLSETLVAASAALELGGRDRNTSNQLRRLARNLESDGSDATANRMSSLAETLEGIAARLR
ncbi:MAG: DUF305 domain-containing protein [Woeseiaceae bacterium]|nr:DUF305 domain-containing protein [Woeseiaceae bacterium]